MLVPLCLNRLNSAIQTSLIPSSDVRDNGGDVFPAAVSVGPFSVRWRHDDLKVNGVSSPMTDTFKQLNAPNPVFRVDKGHVLNVI